MFDKIIGDFSSAIRFNSANLDEVRVFRGNNNLRYCKDCSYAMNRTAYCGLKLKQDSIRVRTWS